MPRRCERSSACLQATPRDYYGLGVTPGFLGHKLVSHGGSITIYRGLETLKVWKRGGLLYMGGEEPGTPLIPEDPTYQSSRFHTLGEGLKSPVEFRVREDRSVILLVERYVYHKGQ